jgi:hypothetical protein
VRGWKWRGKKKKTKKGKCKIKGVDQLYESKEKRKKKELDKYKQTTTIKTTYFKSMPMCLKQP